MISQEESNPKPQEGSSSDDEDDAEFEDVDLSLPSTLMEMLSLEPVLSKRPHDLTNNEATSVDSEAGNGQASENQDTKPVTSKRPHDLTKTEATSAEFETDNGKDSENQDTKSATSEASPLGNKRPCQASSPGASQGDTSSQKSREGQLRPIVTDSKVDAKSCKGRDWAYEHHIAFLDDPNELHGEGPCPHSRDLETKHPRTIYGCRDVKCVKKVVAHDCVMTLARQLGKEQAEEKWSISTQPRAEATEVIDL